VGWLLPAAQHVHHQLGAALHLVVHLRRRRREALACDEAEPALSCAAGVPAGPTRAPASPCCCCSSSAVGPAAHTDAGRGSRMAGRCAPHADAPLHTAASRCCVRRPRRCAAALAPAGAVAAGSALPHLLAEQQGGGVGRGAGEQVGGAGRAHRHLHGWGGWGGCVGGEGNGLVVKGCGVVRSPGRGAPPSPQPPAPAHLEAPQQLGVEARQVLLPGHHACLVVLGQPGHQVHPVRVPQVAVGHRVPQLQPLSQPGVDAVRGVAARRRGGGGAGRRRGRQRQACRVTSVQLGAACLLRGVCCCVRCLPCQPPGA
jgi:hypothetical protein